MIRFARPAFLLLFALGAAMPAASQSPGDTTRMLYTKHEYRIPMRDGVRLYTAVYSPRDTTARYPLLISRTRYGVRSYGAGNYRGSALPCSVRPRKWYRDRLAG